MKSSANHISPSAIDADLRAKPILLSPVPRRREPRDRSVDANMQSTGRVAQDAKQGSEHEGAALDYRRVQRATFQLAETPMSERRSIFARYATTNAGNDRQGNPSFSMSSANSDLEMAQRMATSLIGKGKL
jgi:hypothetical protein